LMSVLRRISTLFFSLAAFTLVFASTTAVIEPPPATHPGARAYERPRSANANMSETATADPTVLSSFEPILRAASIQPAQPASSDTMPPSIPKDLRSKLRDGRVYLSWTASQDAVGVVSYRVSRDGTVVGSTPTTSFMDFPRPGVAHAYGVQAVDAAGNASPPAITAISVPARSSKYVGWDVFCKYAHSAKDDPIVKPAQPGASHLHDFFGNKSADAFSTYSSMSKDSTTCALSEDRAGYWVPALYVDGRQAVPGVGRSLLNGRQLEFKVRYYSTTSESSGITYSSIPADLRMVVGVGSAKTPDENPTLGSRMWWGCTAQEDRAIFPKGRTTAPRHCDSGVASLYIKFPDCWDGIHTDSADHKSHVTNSDQRNRCPASHPKHLPPVIYYIEYFVGTDWTTIELSSGGTSSVHADFWNTWDQPMLDRMVRDCFNAKIWCGTFM